MTPTDAARYRELAEAAWRWVLAQVEDEDGPRIPARVDVDTGLSEPSEDAYRDGLHEGIGGLAHVLAEIRLSRPWTEAEADLAAAVAERLQARIPEVSDASFFDGLSSIVGALIALDAPGADEAVHRLLATAETDGWPPAYPLSPEKHRAGSRINDATLGTASVLLAAIWALRRDVPGARALAERAVDILLAEGEPEPTGTNWRMVSSRFLLLPVGQMPNWSHGLAGIAGSLAVAGTELGRPDLVEAARRGAEHLVTLGDASDGGFVVPLSIPPADPAKVDPISYGWCHGPTGTSMLFLALDRAGVADVAGEPTMSWYARGRHSVRTSGLPDRLRPGFWDNDGRCCGTAGVGRRLPRRLRQNRRRHRPGLRRPAGGRARRAGRSSPTTSPTGGSSSIATRTRCGRPASAGCREPRGSPPTSSGWPGSSRPARTRRPSIGWRTGGRSTRSRHDARARGGVLGGHFFFGTA